MAHRHFHPCNSLSGVYIIKLLWLLQQRFLEFSPQADKLTRLDFSSLQKKKKHFSRVVLFLSEKNDERWNKDRRGEKMVKSNGRPYQWIYRHEKMTLWTYFYLIFFSMLKVVEHGRTWTHYPPLSTFQKPRVNNLSKFHVAAVLLSLLFFSWIHSSGPFS